jgi:hypothetical protein
LGGTAGLLAGLGIIAIPGLGPVVAAGALAATAVGAVAGAATGGVVGALVKSGVPEPEAQVYCEAVRRGGTMVSVRAADDRVAAVQRIMDRHEPIGSAERRTTYTGEAGSASIRRPRPTPSQPRSQGCASPVIDREAARRAARKPREVRWPRACNAIVWTKHHLTLPGPSCLDPPRLPPQLRWEGNLA